MAVLRDALERGQALPREAASAEMVERMREGLLASPFTVNAIRERCRVMFEHG